MKDGEDLENDSRLMDLFDSLLPLMSKIGRAVYNIFESEAYLEIYAPVAVRFHVPRIFACRDFRVVG